MEKKRKFLDQYIKFGFTSLISEGVEKPQCVLCNVVLSAESMKPSKLKRHLETKHAQHINKGEAFFRRHEAGLKRQRLDCSGSFIQSNIAAIEASYTVALEIAKQKKPHTIGETLVKPCLLKTVNLVLGEASMAKVKQISLSNSTIQRRISDMSNDVLNQVINEIKTSRMFSFQVDESTDVSSCAQLLVFVRYIHSGDIKDEFLFCSELDTTTTSADVMEKMKSFFEATGLQWENVCGVCTDGAPAMLGSRSGFVKRVKELAPGAKNTHCFIHRYALASRTLPTALKVVLDAVVKVVNFIKSGSLNTRQFKDLCKDMNATHETLLYHTAVRWLSKGNVLNRVYEMKDEIKVFLELKNKHELLVHFNDDNWVTSLAYLADIFEKLNLLNLKMQGKNTNAIQLRDNISAFVEKLQNWRQKVGCGNIAMFDRLSISHCIDQEFMNLIAEHLQAMESEFQRYFPELKEQEATLARNPFSNSLNVNDIPDQIQEQFIELKNDSAARDDYHEKPLPQFWCAMCESYPEVSKMALRVLLPFATTYLCESGFSTLLHIKTRQRNRIKVEDDMRLALSDTQPRISNLAAQAQAQPSH